MKKFIQMLAFSIGELATFSNLCKAQLYQEAVLVGIHFPLDGADVGPEVA